MKKRWVRLLSNSQIFFDYFIGFIFTLNLVIGDMPVIWEIKEEIESEYSNYIHQGSFVVW